MHADITPLIYALQTNVSTTLPAQLTMAPNSEKVIGEDVLVAAHRGDAQAVTAWLDEGAGVDARCAEQYGVTLLMVAAGGGQETLMRMLLQRGASVNLQNSVGVTALMSAALKGHTTIVQALLDHWRKALSPNVRTPQSRLHAEEGRVSMGAVSVQPQTHIPINLRSHLRTERPRCRQTCMG